MSTQGRSRSKASLIAEAVVIVASILVAFGLDAAWDYRNERKSESELIAALTREFRANRQVLEETMAGVRQGRTRIEAVAGMTRSEIGALPNDSAWTYLQALWRPVTVELSSGVLTSALSSGTLALIQDDGLRESVSGWQGRTDDIRERATVVVRQEEIVGGEVGRIAAELEVALLSPANAPAVLSEVRSDELAMGRVVRKHYSSGVYLAELFGLLNRLDSTLVLLEAS
jgi:hypothetical protein